MKKNMRTGYILFITLTMISLLMFLVNYITNRGITYLSFTKTIIQQEQARVLALGAVQLAISQLQTVGFKEEKADKTAPENAQKQEAKKTWQHRMLLKLYPILYQYQLFKLTEKSESIDATIEFCFSSEDAKVNINQMYDFKEKRFKEGTRKFVQSLCEKIEKKIGVQKLFPALEDFFKKRTYPLEDVTELLSIKEFGWFAQYLFFEPSTDISVEKKGVKPIFLTDIFTVWTKKSVIEPWFLTPSLGALHDITIEKNGEVRKKMIEKQIDSFKIKTSWQADWNKILSPLYGVSWQTIPELVRPLFNTQFEPSIFSVMIRVKVGMIQQKLLAMLERTELTPHDDRYQFRVKLRKVYWL